MHVLFHKALRADDGRDRFHLHPVVIGASCSHQIQNGKSEGHHAQAARHRGIGWGFAMLEEFRSDAIDDCYRRAAEA
jgi:hypothetical protein